MEQIQVMYYTAGSNEVKLHVEQKGLTLLHFAADRLVFTVTRFLPLPQ